MSRSYSLNGLDLRIEKYLPEIGFAIEAGANDGISQSNTKRFEERGWSCLLIEPNLEKYSLCKKNRPTAIVEHGALVSSQYKEKTIEGYFCLNDYENSLCSQVKEVRNLCDIRWGAGKPTTFVPAFTLSSILEKHKIKTIDLFSLDVEGYELEVLDGLDLSKNRPKFLLIEITSKLFDETDEYLKRLDYMFVEKISHHDYIYQAK